MGLFLQDHKNLSDSSKVLLCQIFIWIILHPLPTPSPLYTSTKWIFFLYCEQKVGSSLSLRSVWIIDMGSSLYKSSILSEFRGGEWGSSNIIFQYQLALRTSEWSTLSFPSTFFAIHWRFDISLEESRKWFPFIDKIIHDSTIWIFSVFSLWTLINKSCFCVFCLTLNMCLCVCLFVCVGHLKPEQDSTFSTVFVWVSVCVCVGMSVY